MFLSIFREYLRMHRKLNVAWLESSRMAIIGAIAENLFVIFTFYKKARVIVAPDKGTTSLDLTSLSFSTSTRSIEALIVAATFLSG